jgi:sec-independent protein translocase protein TatA
MINSIGFFRINIQYKLDKLKGPKVLKLNESAHVFCCIFARCLKTEAMLNSILLGMIGPTQVIIIVLVIVLLFGGKKIPELMKGIGRGVREFKDGIDGKDDQDKKDNKEEKKS